MGDCPIPDGRNLAVSCTRRWLALGALLVLSIGVWGLRSRASKASVDRPALRSGPSVASSTVSVYEPQKGLRVRPANEGDRHIDLVSLGKEFEEQSSDSRLIDFLVDLTHSIVRNHAVDFHTIARLVAEGRCASRYRAILIVIASFLDDAEAWNLLRRTALDADDVVAATAVRTAIARSAWPSGGEIDWIGFWKMVLLDPPVGDMLNPGYLERAEESGEIRGQALPYSPWWKGIPKLDPELVGLLQDVSLHGRGETSRIVAVCALPLSANKDALIGSILDDAATPSLVRAVGYNELQLCPSSWGRMAAGLRSERSPRVLAGIATRIVHCSSPENLPTTVGLLATAVPQVIGDADCLDRVLVVIVLLSPLAVEGEIPDRS